MTANPSDKTYVQLDEDGFRKALREERAKLERLASNEYSAGMLTEYEVTVGRLSGVYLALSFLEAHVVRPRDRMDKKPS